MSARFGLSVATPQPLPCKLRSTAVKAWGMCHRKWWFDNVAGMPQADRYHFVVGTVLHSVAERYISRQAKCWEDLFPPGWDAKLADDDRAWARIVAEEAVAKGIWQARPDLHVEYPIAYLVGHEFRDRRGMPLLARTQAVADAKGERTQAIPTSLLDGRPLPTGWNRLPLYASFIDVLDLPTPAILDHKTTKARRYALTSEKLAKDAQVLCYAVTPLALRPEVDRVRLQHNVFLKGENPDVYPVEAEATLESVNACWDGIIKASEDMQLLREVAPRIDVPGHPEERAGNWQRVSSAIEAGTAKEACNAYGGCAYRDVCFGRCTHQQLTRRLDAPDVRKLLEQQGISPATRKFGLAPNTTRPARTGLIVPASTAAKEITMPFPKSAPAALAVNSDAYVGDPENPTIQYRCRVKSIDGQEATLWLYPDVAVAPKFASLSEMFQAVVPLDAVNLRPNPTASVIGYAASLSKAGIVPPQWEPDEPAAQVAVQAAAPTPAKDTRPPRDGKFGLAGAPAAPAAPADVVPAPTFEPQVGDRVQVLPTQHPYWGQYAGKEASITAVGPDGLLTLEIEGLPHDGVNTGRLKLIASAGDAVPVDVTALVGQIVSVRLKGQAAPFNGVLEEANVEGVVMMSGKFKATWDQVEHVGPISYGDIPGAPPPKAPRAKKGATPEGAASPSPASNQPSSAASAPAAMPSATPAGASTPPSEQRSTSTSATSAAPGSDAAQQQQQQIAGTSDPSTALDRVVAAVQAVVNGDSKVTRKAFEALLPPLLDAQRYLSTTLQRYVEVSSANEVLAKGPTAPGAFTRADVAAKLTLVRQEMEALAAMLERSR